MSSSNIKIHEFSTGIHVQQRVNGWVSLGFTGQYMNATINPIPTVVERSIANQEFALTEGSSTEKPAIIGRILGSDDDIWSVMAVVTRGRDEVGRSAAFYRYFLCQGDHNLRFILTWWEQNQKPTFNPLDFQDSPHLFMGESGQPHLTKEDESLPFAQDQAIVLPAENQHDLYTLNALAITKFNQSKKVLPVAWAFNVEALEKPERFQVIQPASQKAYEGLKRAIANAAQVASAINIDEAALKSAIRSLINSSAVKPEVVQEIVKGLENKEVTPEYWEKLFNAQGAEQAIRQKIYSPQMVRLITLKAMVNPKTLPEFLAWLNIQGSKKPDQHQTISLEFQKAIRALFPKEKLSAGIKYLLLNLLNQKISVDSLYWLLATQGSAWVYAQKQFIADIQNDLELIHDHFSSPKTASKTSLYPDPNFRLTSSFIVGSENDSQLHHVQPPIKKDSWQNDFKCQKQIWATLINSWQGIQQGYSKKEEYQTFAELFDKFRQYDLAAYFYQVSDGIVDKDLYDEVANQQHRRSPVVFGLHLEPKKNLIDHVLDFITQECIVPIQFVIPLSICLFLLGFVASNVKNSLSATSGGSFQGSNTSHTHTSSPNTTPKNGTTIDVSDWDTTKESTAISSFEKTKQSIKKIIEDVKKQKINNDQTPDENEIKFALLTVLYKDIGNGRRDLDIKVLDSPIKQTTKSKRWVELIYSYQKRKGRPTSDGIIDLNQNPDRTYSKLKKDIIAEIQKPSS